MKQKITVHFALLGIVVLILSSCTKVPTYDKVAYEKATSLKVDSLKIMDKATNNYSTQKKDVDSLKTNLLKAYEYAKGRPNNQLVTNQWAILINPKRHMIGGFLTRWENKKKLSKVVITEAKQQVTSGFDKVIALEVGAKETIKEEK